MTRISTPCLHDPRRRFLTSAAVLMVALGLGISLASPALAIDPVYSNWRGLAIRGADPVAYFTQGAYVEGKSNFSFEWMEATWRFSSAANRDAFKASPEKYAPRYGGYCAYAVSQGSPASIDPAAFTIVDGKLYLNYSLAIREKWLAKRDEFIKKADAIWPGLRDG